jgi:hypothetical protein
MFRAVSCILLRLVVAVVVPWSIVEFISIRLLEKLLNFSGHCIRSNQTTYGYLLNKDKLDPDVSCFTSCSTGKSADGTNISATVKDIRENASLEFSKDVLI